MDITGVPGGSSDPNEQIARWVELFYDLAFVAATLILSTAVAHTHPIWHSAWFALVFAAAWWVWFSTTILANRFHMADFVHRLLLLAQMLVIVLMAMEARVSLTRDSSALAVEYGFLLATIALIAYRASRKDPLQAAHANQLVVVNSLAAMGFLLAAAIGEPWRTLVSMVALAVAVVPSVIWLHRFHVATVLDEQHLVERIGVFTLIVFGEAFIEVAISVAGATLATIDIVSLIFDFVLVLALFTSYFEDIPAAGLHPRRLGPWAGCHLVLLTCIAAVAIAAAELVDYKTARALPDTEVFKLTVPIAVFYVAMAGLGLCTRRQPAAPLAYARLATAAVVLAFDLIVRFWVPVHLATALPVITVIAVANAAAVMRLRDRTDVVGSGADSTVATT